MDELNDRILAKGVEVRFVAEERDAVDEIADPFCDWVRENWTLEEFFDEGTMRSTHPRYKGTYLRRVHIKTKERGERGMTERTTISSVERKYCPYCGNELPREGSPYFCPNCGRHFAWMGSQGTPGGQLGSTQQSGLPFGLKYRLTDEKDVFTLRLYPSEDVEGLEFDSARPTRRSSVPPRLSFKGVHIDFDELPDVLRETLPEGKYDQLVQRFQFGPLTPEGKPGPMFEIMLWKRTEDQNLDSYQQDLDTLLKELFNAIRRQVNSALSENESLRLMLEKYGVANLDESASDYESYS